MRRRPTTKRLLRPGPDEYARFRQGCANRDELALAVSRVGAINDGSNPLSAYDDSVSLVGLRCTIGSRRLGHGAQVELLDEIKGADRDLGLRLLNSNPPLSWWVVELAGTTSYPPSGEPTHHPAEGHIEPILVTPLGETVAGAWVSPDSAERHYVVPSGTPWDLVLEWLTHSGLPEFVPAATRRARAATALPEALLTPRERRLRNSLAELESTFEVARADLIGDLAEAQGEATRVREGLLYATGANLVDAVTTVLIGAGIEVVDVDEMLAGTPSADLLCSYDGARRLVEVRSASGSAGERSYDDMLRHVREWATIVGVTPVGRRSADSEP